MISIICLVRNFVELNKGEERKKGKFNDKYCCCFLGVVFLYIKMYTIKLC